MLPSMLHTVCVFCYFISLFYQASSNLVNAELDNSLMDGWMYGRKMSQQYSTIISVPVEVCITYVMNGSFVLGLLRVI